MEQMSHRLKTKCNALYKMASEKIFLYGIITETILLCLICVCIISIKDYFLKFLAAVGLFSMIHLPIRLFTRKYWRCPKCGNKLPCELYYPKYVERCPKCNFSFIDEKSLPTDKEILEDNTRRRKIVYIMIGMIIFLMLVSFPILFFL